MNELTFVEINEENKFIAKELLAGYGSYLFDELNLIAGKELFFKELDKFPDSKYQSPKGAFFIIYKDEIPIGCAGLKGFDDNACELKRMYIKKNFRGNGFAKIATKFLLDKAKLLGYKKVLLDTNIEMPAALKAYINAGFVEIPPYCENENLNPVFLAYYL